MKKLVFIFVLLILSVCYLSATAQYCDEMKILFDMINKEEKQIIEYKGYGTVTSHSDLPCDEKKLKNIHASIYGQRLICENPGWTLHNKDCLFLHDYRICFKNMDNYVDSNEKLIYKVEMEFQNNSNESVSFNSALYRELYQDGIQLDDYASKAVDTMTKVRPGMSIMVTEFYEYRTDTKGKGIIEIDIHPYFDGNKAHAYSGVIYRLK